MLLNEAHLERITGQQVPATGYFRNGDATYIQNYFGEGSAELALDAGLLPEQIRSVSTADPSSLDAGFLDGMTGPLLYQLPHGVRVCGDSLEFGLPASEEARQQTILLLNQQFPGYQFIGEEAIIGI